MIVTPERPLVRNSARFAGAILLSLSSVACVLDGPTDAATISNRTGAPIEIYWDQANGTGDLFYASIQEGQARLVLEYLTVCMPAGDLVAKDLQGREVARRAEPLCPLDIWIIEGSPEPSV